MRSKKVVSKNGAKLMEKSKVQVVVNLLKDAISVSKKEPMLSVKLEEALTVAQALLKEDEVATVSRLKKLVEETKVPTYSSLTAQLALKVQEQKEAREVLNNPALKDIHRTTQSRRDVNSALIQRLETQRAKMREVAREKAREEIKLIRKATR